MANRDKLDGWCERGILGLVLAIVCLGPIWFGAVGTGGFLAIQGLTILALGLWTARFWLKAGLRLVWPPISSPAPAFACSTVAPSATAAITSATEQDRTASTVNARLSSYV